MDPSRAAAYPIPDGVHRVEETIQRSRFVTTLAHAPGTEEARAFVERIREEHPDATHHCFAFVAGPPGSTTWIGMSDDGEPHGTAGRPMLTTLLHSGIGEIVAVCSRWFGGVKLGTGGLSRAYSSGVKLALASLPTVERVERVLVEVIVGYAAIGEVQRALAALGGLVESEEFGADARIRCRVPVAALPALRRSVADLTRGGGAVGEV